jgi:phage recombination protein Bet
MTTTTDVAVRNGHAPADAPSGALAIYADQVEWTSMQEAALNQLGLRNASDGDRMVFLHQCQRTGLDPFAKQIHMIERGGKWGIMTGIDGFRVNRSRAERKAGVRGILGQAVYVDAEGNEYKRWFKPMPPVGCEITYTVREITSAAGVIETPYVTYLRFTEYAQYKADGKLTQKWSQSPAHMLEKCTEADVYRKAFPQDFSGISLDDAMPEPDAPAVQRDVPPTADLRQRAQTMTATVIPNPSPAEPDPPVSGPAATPTPKADVAPAGEAKTAADYLSDRLTKLKITTEAAQAEVAARVLGRAVPHPLDDLTDTECTDVMKYLRNAKSLADVKALIAELEMTSDAREDGEPGA